MLEGLSEASVKPYNDYDELLLKTLKSPREAAAYLNVALEENNPTSFLTAYYNVARAHGVKVLAASHLQLRVAACR